MLFEFHQGTWSGTNRLWFEGPNSSEDSPGSLVLTGDTLTVSWSFRDDPQTGTLTVSFDGDAPAVDWLDSWHSKDGMRLEGALSDEILRVTGSYPAGDGSPDWGWRIELDATDMRALVLRMFNITPEGDESLAVELVGRQ